MVTFNTPQWVQRAREDHFKLDLFSKEMSFEFLAIGFEFLTIYRALSESLFGTDTTILWLYEDCEDT